MQGRFGPPVGLEWPDRCGAFVRKPGEPTEDDAEAPLFGVSAVVNDGAGRGSYVAIGYGRDGRRHHLGFFAEAGGATAAFNSWMRANNPIGYEPVRIGEDGRLVYSVLFWDDKLGLGLGSKGEGDWERGAMVRRLNKETFGRQLEAERSQLISVGDEVFKVAGRIVLTLRMAEITELIRRSPRPLMIQFKASVEATKRAASYLRRVGIITGKFVPAVGNKTGRQRNWGS